MRAFCILRVHQGKTVSSITEMQPPLRWSAVRTEISKAAKWLLIGMLRVSLKNCRCEMALNSRYLNWTESQEITEWMQDTYWTCFSFHILNSEKNAFIKNLFNLRHPGEKCQVNIDPVQCDFTSVAGSIPLHEKCCAYFNDCK